MVWPKGENKLQWKKEFKGKGDYKKKWLSILWMTPWDFKSLLFKYHKILCSPQAETWGNPGSWQLAGKHKVISLVCWVQSAFNKSKLSRTVSTRSCFAGATLLTFIFKVYGYLFSQPTYRERDSFNSSWGTSRIIKNKRTSRTHKKNKPVFVRLYLNDSISKDSSVL